MSGENVAAGSTSPEKAVELWYDEITNPGFKTSNPQDPRVGHYTAMMWASTGKVGCAQKACPNGTPNPIHVCHYAMMAPNMGGKADYLANLPATNTPVATEETCCQKLYGDSSGSTNPHLNPLATPAPTQAPAGRGPTVGVFKDDAGKETLQVKPWRVGSVWVYGSSGGSSLLEGSDMEAGQYKYVSVDKDGKKIECRHSSTALKDSMSPGQLQAAWNAASRGGSYSVVVVLGDTSLPKPALKPHPTKGDAEGTVYFSGDEEDKKDSRGRRVWGSKRSSVRRRMRGDYYKIADKANYQLVKSGAQCSSKSKYYGCWLKSAADCAKKAKKEGKKFFVYYENPSFYDYKCYIELTSSASCPEGFSSKGFNSKYSFYSVLDVPDSTR
jgi:hypothetical protein